MVIMASGPKLHQPAINFIEMPSPSAPIVNSQHHSTETKGSHHTNTTGCLSCATALCNPATDLFPDHDKRTRTPFREAAWLCCALSSTWKMGNKMSLIRLIAIVSCTHELMGRSTCLCLPPPPSGLIPVESCPIRLPLNGAGILSCLRFIWFPVCASEALSMPLRKHWK